MSKKENSLAPQSSSQGIGKKNKIIYIYITYILHMYNIYDYMSTYIICVCMNDARVKENKSIFIKKIITHLSPVDPAYNYLQIKCIIICLYIKIGLFPFTREPSIYTHMYTFIIILF